MGYEDMRAQRKVGSASLDSSPGQVGSEASCEDSPVLPTKTQPPRRAHLDKGVSHVQRLLPAERGGYGLPTGDEGTACQAAH